MRLSTKGRYAVMAMADLAGHARGRQRRQPVALADIAERQDISLSYLEQLFAKLRRGGLVTSVRGPGGGYRLSRPSRRAAHRRHHRGGGRADHRHPLQDRQRQGLHRNQRALRHPRSVGRTGPADPRLPVVGVAGRCGGEAGAGPHPALRRARSTTTGRPRKSDSMHYLDHNATSPLRPEARAAMARALGVGGNPSSVHASGPRRARDRRRGARAGRSARRTPVAAT